MSAAEESIEKHEESVFRNIPSIIRNHLQVVTNSYNLSIYLQSKFNGKPMAELNARQRISLVMLARIANDLRCIVITSQFGYGTQACAIAANVWELAWQLAWITRTEEAATQWLKTAHFTSGGPDPTICLNKYLKSKGVPEHEKQAKLERDVYGKLCAMKHGNPKSFSFHSVDDWDNNGASRLGPDLSAFGQKSICFASFMAAQLAELALQEVAQNHLTSNDEFFQRLKSITVERQKVLEECNRKWTSFP